jgi:hypothetical protein
MSPYINGAWVFKIVLTLFIGFARGRVKRRFLISKVSAGRVTFCYYRLRRPAQSETPSVKLRRSECSSVSQEGLSSVQLVAEDVINAKSTNKLYSINVRLQWKRWNRDSSVGIAARYGLDGPEIESRCSEIFRTCPDQLWDPPTQPPIKWAPGLSRG